MTQTPGPWYVTDFSDQFDKAYGISTKPGDLGTGDVCPAGDDNGVCAIQNLDDARLIAAAPDLLEALQAILDSHSEPIEGSDGYNVTCHGRECKIAREAIAKATGEEYPDTSANEDTRTER